MTHLTAMTAADALDRITDWQTALRAENKAPGTVALYGDGATRYLRWCADADHLPMSRAALNSWIVGLLDTGAAPGTARIRQLAVRRFASWLTAGGEIHTDPFPGVQEPGTRPCVACRTHRCWTSLPGTRRVPGRPLRDAAQAGP